MADTTAVLVTWHPDIFLHDQHANHVAMNPHRISSVQACIGALEQDGKVRLELASTASREQFERVHEPEYLDRLAATAHLV